MGSRVNRGHLLELLEPVPEPVAVEADVGLVEPTAGAVVCVVELGFLAHDIAGLHETLVGPAGEGLWHAVAVEFGPQAEVRRVAQVLHPEGLQVGLDHAAADGGVELLAERGIGDGPPRGDSDAAVEDGRLSGSRLVDDRRLCRARVLCGELESVARRTDAAADRHPDATLGQLAAVGLLQRAHGVAGRLQGQRRLRLGAVGLPAASGGDMEDDSRLGQGGEGGSVGRGVAAREALLAALRLGDVAAGRVAVGRRERGIRGQPLPGSDCGGRIIARQQGVGQAQQGQASLKGLGHAVARRLLEALAGRIEPPLGQVGSSALQSGGTRALLRPCGRQTRQDDQGESEGVDGLHRLYPQQ